VFKIGHDGSLTQRGHVSTFGDYPRIFAIDPSGRFMAVGNQFADNVTTFSVNPGNGSLKFTGNYTPLGSPSGMVFLI
jgi:6-phosphogluconolactonase (cycloisomerase 2 family)